MAQHPIITGCLLGTAAALCIFCSIGLAVVRDSYQRIHFSAPVTSIAIVLITSAVWIEDSQWQARIKSALIAIMLFFMNSVLSHATARAIRLRKLEHWEVESDEQVPLLNERGDPIAIVGLDPEKP
jgi:monovalent cation/proton antiporter MnhG/PhaG subunit